MWRTDGTKLSGDYGTWGGQEFELRGTDPNDDGTLTLVKKGGNAPGPGWRTHDHKSQFPGPRFSHTRRVPAEEVTNIHAVRATGEFKPGLQMKILAEDSEGKVAVVAGDDFATEEKWDLIEDYGFHTFHNEPVERSGVFGWLSAEKINNVTSEIYWRKDTN